MHDSADDENPRAPRRRTGADTFAGRADAERGAEAGRPYRLYRSAPRSLTARLRGESDAELEARADQLSRKQPARPVAGPGGGLGSGGGGGQGPGRRVGPEAALVSEPRRGLRRLPGLRGPRRPALHPVRLVGYFVGFCVFWVVLSVVLFGISASGDPGNLPGGNATKAALTSAGPILTSANNILVVGLDNRPTTGYSSSEGGLTPSQQIEADANTDTLMLWRVGGGTSRRLSIPRDTLVDIPACGTTEKINAAWSCGGPKATIQAVESLTGLKINHMIVVDLGNFVKFIDDIGGVTVKTPLICSEISGGAADGGYTLNLSAGVHHLDGVDAVTLARTRENRCNAAYNDFNREEMQQKIMNAIKSQLFSLHAFIHLPWASWDAPKAIQTDMGPLSLMQLFIAAEVGGSSGSVTLGGSFGNYGGADVVIPPSQSAIAAKVQQLTNGN